MQLQLGILSTVSQERMKKHLMRYLLRYDRPCNNIRVQTKLVFEAGLLTAVENNYKSRDTTSKSCLQRAVLL